MHKQRSMSARGHSFRKFNKSCRRHGKHLDNLSLEKLRKEILHSAPKETKGVK